MDDMTQTLYISGKELTLPQIHDDTLVTQYHHHVPHVGEMIAQVVEKDENVVQAHKASPAIESSHEDVDSPLKRCGWIGLTKRHLLEEVGPIAAHKRRFVTVFLLHRDLSVSPNGVQSCEYGSITE